MYHMEPGQEMNNEGMVYEKWLVKQERDFLTYVLQVTGGNVTEVSRRLQINRATLRSKLKRCGLVAQDFAGKDVTP